MPKAKSTVKKAAPTSVTKRTTPVPKAPSDHLFVLVNGRKLADYKELADALEEMDDHTYGHHVNRERNDFAHWIADTLKDMDLANKIRKASGKHHMQIIIYRHILER